MKRRLSHEKSCIYGQVHSKCPCLESSLFVKAIITSSYQVRVHTDTRRFNFDLSWGRYDTILMSTEWNTIQLRSILRHPLKHIHWCTALWYKASTIVNHYLTCYCRICYVINYSLPWTVKYFTIFICLVTFYLIKWGLTNEKKRNKMNLSDPDKTQSTFFYHFCISTFPI